MYFSVHSIRRFRSKPVFTHMAYDGFWCFSFVLIIFAFSVENFGGPRSKFYVLENNVLSRTKHTK